MARYALAAGSKETPPFIRMAAVRPAVVVSPLAAQHFLNFVPLPHGHGSFRPTVIFHSFGRTIELSEVAVSAAPRARKSQKTQTHETACARHFRSSDLVRPHASHIVSFF